MRVERITMTRDTSDKIGPAITHFYFQGGGGGINALVTRILQKFELNKAV